MNDPVRLLMFGNLPPPYGGLPSFLQFALPILVSGGYSPVLLVREREDYSRWFTRGVSVVRLPYGPVETEESVAELRRTLTHAQMQDALEIAASAPNIADSTRYLADLGMAMRVAEAHSIELIHTFHVYHRSVVARAVSHLLGIPAILSIFGEVVAEYYPLPHMWPQVRALTSGFSAITAPSQHCGSGPRLLGLHDPAVQVVPYGVDTEFFRPVSPASVLAGNNLEDRRVILFQGRLSQEKGPQTLIAALPSILHAIDNAFVLFVGPDEGPHLEGPTGFVDVLRKMARDLGVESNIGFTGGVPFADLPAYYSAASVLAFPSTSPKECMGLALKQAMACGIPVVAARAGGACEAVEDGVTGICCEPNDPGALAGAIVEVLSGSAGSEMGRRGRERALKFFTQEQTVAVTTKIYMNAMSAAGRRRTT